MHFLRPTLLPLRPTSSPPPSQRPRAANRSKRSYASVNPAFSFHWGLMRLHVVRGPTRRGKMQLTPFPIPGGITATASVAGSTTNQDPRGRRNFTESQTLLLGPSSSCFGVLGVPEKAWRQVRRNHVHVSNSSGKRFICRS